MTRSLVPPPEPNVGLTLCPVARSKSGIICCTAALIPPGAIRVTSAAHAAPQLHTDTATVATVDSSVYFFMVCLLPIFLFELSALLFHNRVESGEELTPSMFSPNLYSRKLIRVYPALRPPD